MIDIIFVRDPYEKGELSIPGEDRELISIPQVNKYDILHKISAHGETDRITSTLKNTQL